MKKEDALKMLEQAKESNKPSKLNKLLTESSSLEIMKKGIKAMLDGEQLNRILEKRIYQVCKNQKRPKIFKEQS